MSDTVKCRSCGATGDGKFCGDCGAPLGEVARPSFCNLCGTAVKGEERFCTECGASLEAAALVAHSAGGVEMARTPAAKPSSSGSATSGTPPAATAPPSAPSGPKPLLKDSSFLMVITACLLAMGAGVVVGKLGSGGEEMPLGQNTAPVAGNPAAVDLNSMTPREAADRLFNRVVSAAESGDTAQAEQFLPMAIGAHDRAEPLDLDGIFHKTILERLANNSQAAIESAERILEEHPTNLLGLASAAEAAAEGGDDATARVYYQRFLDAYDSEVGTPRPEYEQHGELLPGMRAAALLATGS